MNKIDNNEIIIGLICQNNTVLEHIYDNYFEMIKNFILKNNGDDEDAYDIFQEAIIIIYHKAKDSSFELRCSFSTYLYSVCRLLWLKELNKKSVRDCESLDNNYGETEEIPDITEEYEVISKHSLFYKHFSNLSEECKQVLRYFFDKIPLKEIAKKMGYASENYVKKKKFHCKDKLVNSIKSDQFYKELILK